MSVVVVDRSACADVIELANGGQIQGEVAREDDAERPSYVITTGGGNRVTLPRSQVSRVVSQTAAQEEYHRRARALDDTVDAHWQLAQWCRDEKLRNEYRQELRRILELDPNHEPARRGLGYQLKNGQWMSREDIMAARGLVLYDGKYSTQQHIELLERSKETKLSEADWRSRVERWRRWLTGRRQERAEEALREFRAIRDPEAAAAIVGLLQKERDPAVKHLLMEVAAKIDHTLVLEALVEMSLTDPADDVRRQALDYVIRAGHPATAVPYVRALRNADPVIVNRAAEALGEIGNRDAIGPLISALVTKRKVVVGSGSADQHSYMFTPSGGTAMNFGGGGAKVVTQPVENPAVLASLVKLSGGVALGYDQAAWRNWLSAQAKAQPIDLRRDE